ncbi:hypothetical protein F6T64_23170 [Escherichia coli]|nr:hypothetical protein [Escherichia coli]
MRATVCNFMALQNGHEEAVQAYGELLISAGLSQEKKAALLDARIYHGIPGLLMSLYKGHAKSIYAYGEIRLNAGLSQHRSGDRAMRVHRNDTMNKDFILNM